MDREGHHINREGVWCDALPQKKQRHKQPHMPVFIDLVHDNDLKKKKKKSALPL